jgi:division protein CdvB (Snf7/Vps24/ESCRT-III family)
MPFINHRKPVLSAIVAVAGLGLAAIAPVQAATTQAPATTTAPAPAAAPTTTMTPSEKATVSHVDARLAKLKQSIGITTSEEASWQGFVQVSRTNALNLDGLYEQRSKSLATMNAVENMESYSAILAKNADDMNNLSAAFQTLYTQLTPDQQKKIDAEFRAKAEMNAKKHVHKLKHS